MNTILEELSARNQRVTDLEQTLHVLTRMKAPTEEIERVKAELLKAEKQRDWLENAVLRHCKTSA